MKVGKWLVHLGAIVVAIYGLSFIASGANVMLSRDVVAGAMSVVIGCLMLFGAWAGDRAARGLALRPFASKR